VAGRAAPPVIAVLDSEALAALALPHERTRAARRAQAVLTAIERLGGRACVPAPVIAEVARSAARRAAVDRVLRRLAVIDTGRSIATLAGQLLGAHGLDSSHAVDAFVAATAHDHRPAMVLTGDPDDLHRLTGDFPGVGVQALP
jgi:predicted nucleic acid-binding protein